MLFYLPQAFDMQKDMKKPARRFDQGFTIIEVVVVLLLISIFAVMAVTRQPHPETALRTQCDILASHLRYAQMRAMNTDEPWGIGIDANAGRYWLFRGHNDAAHRRHLPGQDELLVDLTPKGVTIACQAATLSFDSWGRPQADDSLISASSLPVILSKDGRSQTLDITRNTGFIP